MTYISWYSRFCLIFPTLPNRKASYFGYLFSLILSMTIFFEDHCDLKDPVILPYISDPIKQEGMILWIHVQSDTVNDIILFAGHCDLYYMVQ